MADNPQVSQKKEIEKSVNLLSLNVDKDPNNEPISTNKDVHKLRS